MSRNARHHVCPEPSINSEPLRIVWVRTPEGKARLLPHAWPGNEGPIMSAPVADILARDTRFHEELPDLYPFLPDLRDALEDGVEWRDRIGVLSSNIQAGYMILAIRALAWPQARWKASTGPTWTRNSFLTAGSSHSC